MNGAIPRIGISSASYFDRLPLEDIVTDFTSRNTGVCELFLNTRSEYTPDFIALLKERLSVPGAPYVYSVHPMGTHFEPQLFSTHPRQNKDAWETYLTVLDAAKTLGARCYVMHGPIMMQHAAYRPDPGRFVSVLRELNAAAKDRGIVLTLENVSWCLLKTPDTGKYLADALGDDLHYTIDIKQAERSGYSPLEFIRSVSGLIENVHLCDHIRTEYGFRWMLPGKGETDLDLLFSELESAGCTGPYFIEVYSNSYGDIEELHTAQHELNRLFGGNV